MLNMSRIRILRERMRAQEMQMNLTDKKYNETRRKRVRPCGSGRVTIGFNEGSRVDLALLLP